MGERGTGVVFLRVIDVSLVTRSTSDSCSFIHSSLFGAMGLLSAAEVLSPISSQELQKIKITYPSVRPSKYLSSTSVYELTYLSSCNPRTR